MVITNVKTIVNSMIYLNLIQLVNIFFNERISSSNFACHTSFRYFRRMRKAKCETRCQKTVYPKNGVPKKTVYPKKTLDTANYVTNSSLLLANSHNISSLITHYIQPEKHFEKLKYQKGLTSQLNLH